MPRFHFPVISRRALAVAAALAMVAALVTVPSAAAPSRSDLRAAQDRLQELEREFQLVSERYNLVNERLTRLQAEIGATELEIDRISERMGVREDAAVELATELYKGGSVGSMEVVLSSDTIGEMETRLEYLESSNEAHSLVFERLAVDRGLLDSKVDEMEVAQAQALVVQEELSVLREDIEEKVIAEEDEIRELNEAIERAEALARERAAAEAALAAAAQPSGPIGVTPEAVGAEPASNPQAQAAVEAALSQIGKPYQWGAAGPDTYDCSGLTMWAWAQAGVGLPHNSGMQYDATSRVAWEDLEPGDLLFFGAPIHHVGMYIGNNQMVEAPYTGMQVRVVSAFRSDFAGAGRP